MTRAVLVIGATGILGPAASTLSGRGQSVVRVARHEADSVIAVDAGDTIALATALDGRRWDDALVYGPAVSDAALDWIRRATPGRCVLVRTSAASGLEDVPSVVPRDTLQLGWTADSPPRWHTPAEVSEAALDVLASGDPRTLGLVRPWSARP